MKHFTFALSLLCFAPRMFAQENQHVKYTTPFVIHSVTYNGSPDPEECWESVEWGIQIQDEKNKTWFFSMPYEDLMRCQELIGASVAEIETVFFAADYGEAYSHGNVTRIMLDGEVIFNQ